MNEYNDKVAYLNSTGCAEIRRATVAEQITQQQVELDKRMVKLNRLAELLKNNPEFEELLNLTREIL
jgi:hypothetical protein